MKNSTLITLLTKYKVIIPPIQRDYAQGRKNGKIPHIRKKFIEDLLSVLIDNEKPKLELDFIYGYIEKDTANNEDLLIFKPLDGQQRITTLYLLYWYISRLEKKESDAKLFLQNFSYATRKSSREFCAKLVEFHPDLNGKSFDEQIVNQPWFFSSWNNDPTINSMLVVLKEIHSQINLKKENYWSKLTNENSRIVFHLLPMNDLGLPDDLYIKMNARGKELTNFEHFKSRFSDILDHENAKLFNTKIDKEWSDLFWNTFKDDEINDIAQKVDSGFLSFFWFISDIIVRKQNINTENKFWLDNIENIYRNKPDNISFLFRSLELFESFESKGEYNSQSIYFENIFYTKQGDFNSDKVRFFYRDAQVNLFKKCAENYGYGEKKNNFSVGEQLMLYAFIYMYLSDKFDVSKFRFIRNIFSSSEDQLRNEYLASFLYSDIEKIIDDFDTIFSSNEFTADSKLSKRQLLEEKIKTEFINGSKDLKDIIYKVEDHNLLRGNIAIFNFDSNMPLYANKFLETFTSDIDYLAVSKSLLTIGDYGQKYGALKRYGNKSNASWRELLTQSEGRKGFDNTKLIFTEYLEKLINGSSDADLIKDYFSSISETSERDFAFYKIKYDSFTVWNDNQTNGFYHWKNPDKYYQLFMLFRKQFNGRHWNPFLLTIASKSDKCYLDNFGDDLKLVFKDYIFLVENINEGFLFKSTEEKGEVFLKELITHNKLDENNILIVDQNKEGIDLEDRIEKFLNFIK